MNFPHLHVELMTMQNSRVGAVFTSLLSYIPAPHRPGPAEVGDQQCVPDRQATGGCGWTQPRADVHVSQVYQQYLGPR